MSAEGLHQAGKEPVPVGHFVTSELSTDQLPGLGADENVERVDRPVDVQPLAEQVRGGES
jgi:hypothetical protein